MSTLKKIGIDDLEDVSGGKYIGGSNVGKAATIESDENKARQNNGKIGSYTLDIGGDNSSK